MSRAAYLLTLGAVAVLALLAPSAAAVGALAALVLIPAVCAGAVLAGRGKLRLELSAPDTAQKGEEVPLTLRLTAPGLLPMGKTVVIVTAENAVTGQKLRQKLTFTGSESWSIRSDYCGCLTIRLQKAGVFDPLGVLRIPLRTEARKRVLVLPETFPVLVEEDAYPSSLEDARDYAPDRRGRDRTETFQIRDYTPGDDLKSIHWKLSSKLGSLVVRDPACPVDRDLMVFVDRGWGGLSPEKCDAVLEAAVSVCQSLSEAGTPFRLCWTEETIVSYEVTDPDRMAEAVGALLRSKTAAEPGTDVYLGLRGPADAARVIWLGGVLPDSIEAFGAGSRMVCLLCGQADMDGVICFGPESTAGDLARVYWS